MTVRDLIEFLQREDPDAEAMRWSTVTGDQVAEPGLVSIEYVYPAIPEIPGKKSPDVKNRVIIA